MEGEAEHVQDFFWEDFRSDDRGTDQDDQVFCHLFSLVSMETV